jgi:metal-responsive CopG/Arc/MetJ family transcriptional regulator
MRSTKVLSISVPPSLWDEIGEVAEKEKMTRSELLRVAARDYIRSRRWAELREKGARTAAKYGVKSESDVDRILHEFRTVEGELKKELLLIQRRLLTVSLRYKRDNSERATAVDVVAELKKDRSRH